MNMNLQGTVFSCRHVGSIQAKDVSWAWLKSFIFNLSFVLSSMSAFRSTYGVEQRDDTGLPVRPVAKLVEPHINSKPSDICNDVLVVALLWHDAREQHAIRIELKHEDSDEKVVTCVSDKTVVADEQRYRARLVVLRSVVIIRSPACHTVWAPEIER